MDYVPPKDTLQVLQTIEYEESLGPGDPRYVDTQAARGSQRTLDRLARKFGLSLSDDRFFPPTLKHVLFFGHTGSGKTTELRQYKAQLEKSGRFFVVEIDITVELDRNNVQYADIAMAMARALVAQLERVKPRIGLKQETFEDLERWFAERVQGEEKVREFVAEIESGAEVEAGIPLLAKLFSKFSAAFKNNVTYKDELRRVVRNTFSQFRDAFNRFLRGVEEALQAKGLGRRVLFIVDGSDKLRGEDTRRFFIEDAEQLLQIEAHVVYTAPLALKYEGGLVGKLDADLVLPMIKVQEANGTRSEAGFKAMREILLRRADRALFQSEEDVERLVTYSGGHPRELLRLLKLCCELTESNRIDAATVDAAVKQLASEYRRLLEPDDYPLLAKADSEVAPAGNDERTRRLLYNLALLEYNDGSWRRSHPVIRTLDGYKKAHSQHTAGG